MRIYTGILFFLACFQGYAQNYDLIHPEDTLFYRSGEQLYSLRIDSVGAGGSEMYFSRQLHLYQECATPYGASWIGEKVVKSPSGSSILFNKYRDSIHIRSRAGVGESWLAFRNGEYQISASISDVDTMHIFGIPDSVKTIVFEASDPSGSPLDIPLNNYSLKISRSHGLIETLNFLLFPDIVIMDFKHTEERLQPRILAGMNRPRAGIRNLLWFEVYDFQPGDELHTLDEFSYYEFPGVSSSLDATTRKTMIQILSRTTYPDSLVYVVEKKQSERTVLGDKDEHLLTIDTSKWAILPHPEFDMLPGEAWIEGFSACAYLMKQEDHLSKILPGGSEIFGDPEVSCWSVPLGEGCFMDRGYVKGLGGPYGECYFAYNHMRNSKKLVYYKKGDETWGLPHDLTGREDPLESPNLEIYPNPATEYVHIQSHEGPIGRIAIIAVDGRLVVQIDLPESETTLDISSLEPGLYILKHEKSRLESQVLIIQ